MTGAPPRRPTGRGRAGANRVAAVAVLSLLGAASPLRADVDALNDTENPRNVRFSGQVIDFISASPSLSVRDVGSSGTWSDGTPVTWSFHGIDPRAGASGHEFVFYGRTTFLVDGKPIKTVSLGKQGAPGLGRLGKPMNQSHATWVTTPGRHEISVAWDDSNDACAVASDSLRVRLIFDRKTFEDGERRFGSFVRRFRKSLEDLHALFAASSWPLAPVGIVDRFRIDAVDALFEGKPGERPPGFDSHPESDVVVFCQEGGPVAGFSLPEYSIGHNFTGPDDHRGIWSSWGEQALWHELMHFRGVQDFYIYEVPDGALPGRWKGVLPLPKRYAEDLMNSPYQKPVLGEYAAVVANSKKGIARVGACEDTDNRYGHMWNWLPGRIDLSVAKDKKPLVGAKVRWWRSRAIPDGKGAKDPRQQGVAAGRPPDGEATSNEAGRVSIGGDYMGRGDPRPDRSLWLLVEVLTEVESGGETRFEVLYGLDMNLAYARGDKFAWSPALEFERLLAPNGAVPVDR